MSDKCNSIAICDSVEKKESQDENLKIRIRNPYDSALHFFVKSDYFSEDDDPFIKYMSADKDVVIIEGSISVSF